MDDVQLRKKGLKVTTARLSILNILTEGKQQHLSAEEIYQKLYAQGQDVGLATVYRVLTQFEAAGLVRRHHFEGESSVFELEMGEHHDHLVCLRCGAVTEFVDETIETRQRSIAEAHGFEINNHSLTIYGICKACRLA